LRSPHLRFEHEGTPLEPGMVRALDRALFEARYGGDRNELRRLADAWSAVGKPKREAAAVPAALVAATAADELDALTRKCESSRLLECLLRFLVAHRARPPADPDTEARESRGRAAVMGFISDLRDAHLRYDDPVTDLPEVTSTLRRLIEGATFAAPTGEGGVTLVDSGAARYGLFDNVFLVGLLDGEWPERRRQSSLFPASLLSQLGWSRDIERLRAARAGLADLLGLATSRVSVSTVAFEDDAVVAGSALLEDLEDTALPLLPESFPLGPVTAEAGLAERPDAVALPLDLVPTEWLRLRRARGAVPVQRYRGTTGPREPSTYAVSAVERYLSCPFKYFAASVLRLGEEPDDELIMAPRTRGRFVHEVFRAFFEQWQQHGSGPIDVERLDEARTMARTLAEELLATLPLRDRAVERVWLLGSPAGMGVIDRLLTLEADRPGRVIERLLEHRFDGEYQLEGADGPRSVRLRGIADRIDLLEGGRLRVIDYKTGHAPTRGQALQLPVYGRCAEQELDGRHETTWQVDSAAYVAFGEARAWVPLDRRHGIGQVLSEGQQQFLAAVDEIEQGHFQVRPAEPYRCVYCEYPTVCRKDYVGDE
jgi:CRISPR/Cas system-associated exonuclease Cas4 (RecB family)